MVVLSLFTAGRVQPPPLFIPWPGPLGAGVPELSPPRKSPQGGGSGEGAGLHNLLVTWWGRRAQKPAGFGDPHSWERG